jgi:hypothetical protein
MLRFRANWWQVPVCLINFHWNLDNIWRRGIGFDSNNMRGRLTRSQIRRGEIKMARR